MMLSLIIAAGGKGVRFDGNKKKQFYQIDNKPILYYTLKSMLNSYPFSEVVLGVDDADIERVRDIYDGLNSNVPLVFARSGKVRAETVINCLMSASGDIVAVHDAVRPFITKTLVESVIDAARLNDGAICGLPVRDTVKKMSDGILSATINRDELFLAHTPQVFKRTILLERMQLLSSQNTAMTDEASAFDGTSYKVAAVNSSPDNIKITFKEDLELVYLLIKKYFIDV